MQDDGHRYELVDETLVMSPSPRHCTSASSRDVDRADDELPEHLEVLPAPVDVVLSDNTVFIPDVVVGRPRDFTLTHLPVCRSWWWRCCRRAPAGRLKLKRAKLPGAGCPNYGWLIGAAGAACLALRDGCTARSCPGGDEIVEVCEPFRPLLSPLQLVAPYGR